MNLSAFEKFGLTILRDGEFKSLGLLPHQQDAMLVVLYDVSFLDVLLANPAISCVVTSSEIAPQLPRELGVGTCPDPMAMFYRIHSYLLHQTTFYGEPFATEISPTARVARTAHVAEKNVRIGARSVVEAGAILYGGTLIGDDVVVRSGAVIGGEGFEPKTIGGRHFIVPHAGGVRVGNRVEILCNSHIAKCVFGGYTEVGEDTKIDVLVHISHNVEIGSFCEIAAGTIVSGSVSIGEKVWIGPGAVISSEVSIGSGAFVALGSVISMNVPAGAMVAGNPGRIIKRGLT